MSRYSAITQAAIDHLARGGCIAGSVSGKELQAAVEATHPGAIARARERIDRERFDSRFVGPVPVWTKRYVRKYAESDVRSLRIRQSRHKVHSSGHCWYGSGDIVVTFGASKGPDAENERKATVLHELAHAVAPFRSKHGDLFYDEWYRLLRAENLYRWILGGRHFVGTTSLRAAARRARRSEPLTRAS